MWRLVGLKSKKVYKEGKSKADLNKWFQDTYTKGGVDYNNDTCMNAPEAMRYVKVGTPRKRSEIEQEMLDNGDYEAFRKSRGLSISKLKKDKYIGEISMLKHNMKAARQSLIPEMLNQGLSCADIAWKLGVEIQTIHSDLRELGIKVEESKDKKTRKQWTKKDDDFLIAERSKGATFDEIGRKLDMEGFNVASHWYKLRKNDLPKK